ncbi:MAG: hypothetical protein AAF721_05770, partial [Myxococcota bacterium]
PGGVLLTGALHDAIGLGWRGRIEPHGDFVLERDLSYPVFRMRGVGPDVGIEATVETHDDGLHWRCPCAAHGRIPPHTGGQMRLRCSRCSSLLLVDSQQPAPQPLHPNDHPLSSIVLTAPPEPQDDADRVDRSLIAAMSDPNY